MTNNFKPGIDRQRWVLEGAWPTIHAAGMGVACDLRNSRARYPFIGQLISNTVFNRYNVITKGANFVVSPALAGTFGAGAGAAFAPSRGLTGTIGSGSTTTEIVTSTTITSVAANMLANRGGTGDFGFKVRIIGNAAGSSGKVEERWIIANTSGTTPKLYLDTALTFSPISGDTYEILAGRFFFLGASTSASGSWKSYEVAANTLATLGYTNLPTTIGTDFCAAVLDEQYVPYDADPGEGLITGSSTYDASFPLSCLLATASGASSITGQASSGDAVVLANDYRNCQIRIVEDTAIPTAVNQRAIIASHTAGASPVYTLGAAWAVTPSANAKFVIELPNLILIRSSATTSVYTYNYGTATINNGTNTIAANAWSTSYFGVAGGAMAAGACAVQSYGIRPDAARISKQTLVYFFRGGNGSTVDVLNIAGGTTGSWENAATYDGAVNLNTGSCAKYAPCDQEGRFGYFNAYSNGAINQIFRFDVKNRVMSPYSPTQALLSGTAAAGDRIATYCVFNGDTEKYTTLHLTAHLAAQVQELIVKV